ncbi:MAG: winged helix-turn-helix transcriptional regulator, partial [Bacteroidetes bacterium]|nr:winged helix-turn-helix transcriptional regulator [Bacteroidota bacterium]
MKVLKIIADPVKLKRASKMLRTVSHPSRLTIIDLLLERGKMSVNDIQEHLGISQSNTSQHLKALEDVEIIISARDGRKVLYYIHNTH